MFVNFLLEAFESQKESEALVWKEKSFRYESIIEKILHWKRIISEKIPEGSVVILDSDFSPNTISILFALTENKCITVPMNSTGNGNKDELAEIAQAEYQIKINEFDDVEINVLTGTPQNDLYVILKSRKHPGLVLFSSGTSGKPKAAVHDFTGLLEKFKTKRTALRTLNFLLFDHWGGLNTMLHTLSNCGTIICTSQRSPDTICGLIERYMVELLPVSPTFLNLLLLSEAYKRFDLSSLKIISYGTEAMASVTLEKLIKIFHGVKFQQTYGLIEVGVMRTKSMKDGSLWLKLGGEGFQTRVIDDILQIKSKSAILGYLNYPSPFTEDGWFITGDHVKVNGDYFKILGRKSEIINVGGEKVYPSEIEGVIKELENVEDVSVFGEKNPITGNIICANVSMIKEEDKNEFRSRLKKYCRGKLAAYKVPSRINIVTSLNIGERFKKKNINNL